MKPLDSFFPVARLDVIQRKKVIRINRRRFERDGLVKIRLGGFLIADKAVVGLPHVIQKYRVCVVVIQRLPVKGERRLRISLFHLQITDNAVHGSVFQVPKFIFQNVHRAVKMPFLRKNNRVIDVEIRLFRGGKPRQRFNFFQNLQRPVETPHANQQNAVSAQQPRLVHPLFIGLVVKLQSLFILVFSVRGKRFVADHIAHKAHGWLPPCCAFCFRFSRSMRLKMAAASGSSSPPSGAVLSAYCSAAAAQRCALS